MAQGIFTLNQVSNAISQSAWPNLPPSSVDYLIVAGGGGGGGNSGGGGGAGGLLAGTAPVASGSAITVTVGAAGAGAAYNAGTQSGGSGGNSGFGSLLAVGGGGGGADQSWSTPSGGSGGGGGMRNGGYGAGTAGQGNMGGFATDQVYAAAGGGGAGSRGIDAHYGSGTASYNGPGAGGAGVASAISGTVTAYAGGGGGGVYVGTGNFGPAAGGAGGGGAGGRSPSTSYAVAGTANTGGGGGGAGSSAGDSYSSGANGGSGVVVISYPDIYNAPTSTTGSPTVSTSGSGSINFASSGYLSTGTGTAPSRSGDFTLECWLNLSTFNQNGGYALFCGTSSGSNFIGFYGTNFMFCSSSGGSPTQIACTLPSTNTWFHYCLMRSGSTVYAFLNGVLQGTTTWSETLFAAGSLLIGGYGSAYFCPGYMSNFRVTNTAVYSTSGFTPPTTPLTNVTGTAVLMNTISGAYAADTTGTWSFLNVYTAPVWSSSSPFTVTGYKNRVYTWTSNGSITF